VDPDGPAPDGVLDFFFMEMNTRLQVEHPVTELAVAIGADTGRPERLDLVEWQLRVAAGESLTFDQSDVSFLGHAIEARICAEDPDRDFLPTGGRILLLDEPHGPGIRVDSGVGPGTEVGSRYDPMLAKVIAYGPDRPTALRRLRAALAETRILGVTTNTGYLRRLLAHPDVAAGRLDTGLVERTAEHHPELLASPYVTHPAGTDTPSGRAHLNGSDGEPPSVTDASTAPPVGASPVETLYYAAALGRHLGLVPAVASNGWTDPFSVPSGWRLGGEAAWTTHRLRLPGHEPVSVHVRPAADRNVSDTTDNSPDTTPELHIRLGEGPTRRARAARAGGRLHLTVDGLQSTFAHATDNGPGNTAGPVTWLGIDGDAWPLHPYDPVADRTSAAAAHHGALTAPMPGTVTVVKVTVGEQVRRGQPLLVLEAMKMEHVIAAPHDGTVSELRAAAGTTVAMEELLAVVAPSDESSPEVTP
jgi:acetyl-CoA/propionyl-CoA carboxylase biotin carboxyl carrier protein